MPETASVKTTAQGGSGGTTFTSSIPEPRITKLKAWVDKGAGEWSNRDLVKDVELTWNTGAKSSITGNHNGTAEDFQFANDEKIKRMTIFTGARVDQITFVTDKKDSNGKDRTFSAGGSNGTAHAQSTGKGVFLGFQGTWSGTDKELVSLGSQFKD